jgi:toxin ParE1/3/4
MGRKVGELAPNLRSLPVGSYLIFYRPIDDGIQLIRVLHGARDITPEHFAEG